MEANTDARNTIKEEIMDEALRLFSISTAFHKTLFDESIVVRL